MEKKKLDAEFALHEFSVRYRAALAKRHALTEQNIWGIRDAVRQQYLDAQRGSSGIEAPAIESPKIEPPTAAKSGIEGPKIEEPKIEKPKIEEPKIEPPRKQREMDGPEPDI